MGPAVADIRRIFEVALPLVAVSGIVLAVQVWHRRDYPAGRSFFVVMCSGALWAVADWLGIMSRSDRWLGLSFVAVHTVSISWLIFCLEFTGRRRWITSTRVVILTIIPVICTTLEITNDWHYLVWRPRINKSDDFGIFWWISTLYDYAALAAGVLYLLRSFGDCGSAQRRRILLLIVAASFPWLADFLQFTAFYPRNAPNPATLAFSGQFHRHFPRAIPF
jgi:hypothetical protein